MQSKGFWFTLIMTSLVMLLLSAAMAQATSQPMIPRSLLATPWHTAEDASGDLIVTTQDSDINGIWSSSHADSSAEAVAMWADIVAYNKQHGMTGKDFTRMIPGETTYRVPVWRAEQFKAWYKSRNNVPTATSAIESAPESTNPGRGFPGFLGGLLAAGALVGATTLGTRQRRRLLQPSNANPMRQSPLENVEDAATEVREQILAFSRLNPTSPESLVNPEEWTIVSAVRGLGNGAVESHFSNGSTRKENFHNEPCYEVTARNTSGEERKFYIRIKCANQLTGLTGQFGLDDFTFTPGGDAVELNMPFVPAADPTPATTATADSTPAATSTESAPAPTDEAAPTEAAQVPAETEADLDLVKIEALGEGQFRITRSGQPLEVNGDYITITSWKGFSFFHRGNETLVIPPKSTDTTPQA
ncbi:MAG: hypothetical protein H6760_01035 [Candidatus Nomurabacteria bacterium]|nr:MAG: hypothetical protein H6760_01035 [Candidatus Nomurabacteria bacterium]